MLRSQCLPYSRIQAMSVQKEALWPFCCALHEANRIGRSWFAISGAFFIGPARFVVDARRPTPIGKELASLDACSLNVQRS